ncbi:hypothetical protein SteCoe_33510 [Stentor coeruleus]|uniref:Uncharacterized protein n=1 Tax=Stentor coeruleus TaxID=5963 RepID=A0A1R2AWJ7_9CILI|nr:hypothetical protein SteCoe_33510 [Stentor coeruleus]
MDDTIEKSKPKKDHAKAKSIGGKMPKGMIVEIPLLNKDTASVNTYDIDMLLDKKVQKDALGAHRIKSSQYFSLTKNASPNSANSSKSISSAGSKNFSTSFPRVEAVKKGLQEKKAKIEKLQNELIENELKECTFAPKILAQKKPRNHEEYYKDQMKFEEKKQEKLKNIQKELSKSVASEMSSFSFAPSISEKSVFLASKHVYNTDKYDRMSKGLKPKIHSDDDDKESQSDNKNIKDENTTSGDFTFTPTLNLRSKNMLRMTPVDEILYEDAKRRIKLKNENKIVQNTEFTVNPNSEKMLIEKFCKEYMEICLQENVNYSDYYVVLQDMYFALGNERCRDKEKDLAFRLWSRVSQGQETTPSERLLMNLLAIMKYQTAMYTDSVEAISPEETESLHLAYILFYENRTSVTNKSTINRSINCEEPTFTPELCPNSKKIMESINIEDIQKRHQQKKMEIIKEVEEKAFDECTFQPMISPSVPNLKVEEIRNPMLKDYLEFSGSQSAHRAELLYTYSVHAKEKKEDLLREEKEKLIEKELSQCTFAPVTSRKITEKSKEEIRRSVDRLAQAKKQKIQKNNKNKFLKEKTVEEREQKFREWEEKKLQEKKKELAEKQALIMKQKEKEMEEKRRIEENKKFRYEKLKQMMNEKKKKSLIDKRQNSRVLAVSALSSYDNSVDNFDIGKLNQTKEKVEDLSQTDIPQLKTNYDEETKYQTEASLRQEDHQFHLDEMESNINKNHEAYKFDKEVCEIGGQNLLKNSNEITEEQLIN